MIPLIPADPGKSAGQPAARAEIPRDSANGTAFGDLMESPDIPVENIVNNTGVAVDMDVMDKDPATPDPSVVPIAAECLGEMAKVMGPLVPDGSKGARMDADGAITFPADKDSGRRTWQVIVHEGALRDQTRQQSRLVELADAPHDDTKVPRSSVAQSLVEGRLPQAAIPESQQKRNALGGTNGPVVDAAAPRPAVLPNADQARPPIIDQRGGPRVQAGVIFEEKPHPRIDETTRTVTAKSGASASAAVQPPAVAFAEVSVQPQDKIVEQILKGADGEVTIVSASVERHAPTAGSQAAVLAAASPETARHAATQIAVAITNNAGKSTEIAMNPEELGRVRLSLSASDGAITLNVVAERPETQDLLRRHLDLLAQEFRQLGYTSISFSFGEQNGEAHSDGPQADEVTEPEVSEVTNAANIPPEAVHSGLDLRI